MCEVTEHIERFSLPGHDSTSSGRGARTRAEHLDIRGLKLTRYTNEFWTSAQRKAHSLHEISYRACFKPQLPRFFISLLTAKDGLVYDPFMGRGTTLLEAALLGRRVAGNDSNPLSRILVEPRLRPPTLGAVEDRLASIPIAGPRRADIDLSMFYSPRTEAQLVALRTYLMHRRADGAEDDVDSWIRMVATNRLTGHSAGFFSVYTLPPNQAVSPDAQRRINARRRQEPPDRDVRAIIQRKSKSLLRSLTPAQADALKAVGPNAQFFCQDAAEPIPRLENSVDLVITSPPFLDIVQYAQDNWLRCWFNGIDAGQVAEQITTARRLEQWEELVRRVLAQLRRMLKPRAWIAFEVGEVRKGSIRLDEVVAPLGVSAGLDCSAIMVNKQSFTKTANCWGVKNNSGGTNSNRIVLFRKRTEIGD